MQAKYNEYMDIECKGMTMSYEFSPFMASHLLEELAIQLMLVSEQLATKVNTLTVPLTPRTGTLDPNIVWSIEIGYKLGDILMVQPLNSPWLPPLLRVYPMV